MSRAVAGWLLVLLAGLPGPAGARELSPRQGPRRQQGQALPLAGAAGLAKGSAPWTAADVQDVIYLTDARPVLLRLHLTVDGRPYSVQWQAYLKKLFAYLDRDNNGYLDLAEVERMPSAFQVSSVTQMNGFFQGNIQAPPFTLVDTDRDGNVTFDEFAGYYALHNVLPVRLFAMPSLAFQSTVLSDVVFQALDTDKDGKLSKAELRAAETVLRKYDMDEDDLVSAQELLQLPQGVRRRPGLVRPQPQPGNLQTPFLLVNREDEDGGVANHLKAAQDVLARYDRNNNGKLSRDEVGLPRPLFDQLQPDEKGEVDAPKLLRWLLALPDVELTVRVGTLAPRESPLAVVDLARRKLVPALPIRQTDPSVLTLALGGTSLNVMGTTGVPGMNANGYRQFFQQQFRLADPEKKGALTAKQLEPAQFAFLRPLLKLADRNEDGQLTEKELLEYYDIMAGVGDVVTTLTFTDEGQNLFDILDTNRDGRLSVRELRQAWDRVARFDLNRDGFLAKAELPRQLHLTASKGPGGYTVANLRAVQGRVAMQAPAPIVQPAAGPLWFRKMDVNGDGDVSPREFLGSPEDFARIDSDGDGLISVEEAIKADAWFRDKLKPTK